MKNLLLSCLFILISQTLIAQCPQNTVPGSTVNVFDWRTEYFTFYLKDGNQQIYQAQVSSPFYISNNSAQFNTDHFAEVTSIEFEPSDGWEIIFYNFGTSTEGVSEPSFALYNRYSGIFRFFMYLTANGEFPYGEAFISTYFSKLGEEFHNSALFESQNAIHHPLDNFEKLNMIQAINRYNEGNGTWIVSEWLSHFDPCTCNNNLKLTFEPELQNISLLSLDIKGQSTTVPIYSTNSSYNSGDFRGVIGTLNTSLKDISGIYKKGGEAYSSFAKFKSINSSSSDNGPKIAKVIGTLLSGSIGGVSGVISAATTLLGATSTKTISSYNSTHSFEATGTQTTAVPYDPAEVYVPGSNHNNLPPARVPIYDNILGIATVLNTPRIFWNKEISGGTSEEQGGTIYEEILYTHNYQIKDNIQYIVNQNAGIKNTPTNIKVALYFHLDCNSCIPDNMSGLIEVTSNKIRTPFMNPSCLKEYPVSFEAEFDSDFGNSWDLAPTPYIAVMMILESTVGNKKIAYLKSYKVNSHYKGSNYMFPANQFLDIPEDLTINYNEINGNTETWGTTTVLGSPFAPFGNGDGTVTQNPDGTWNYDTQNYTKSCGNDLPVTINEAALFCNSNSYNSLVSAQVRNVNSNPYTRMKLYPNPTTSMLNIDGSLEKIHSYVVIDVLGNKVLEDGLKAKAIDCSQLNSGLYYIQFLNNNNKIIYNEKFIKY